MNWRWLLLTIVVGSTLPAYAGAWLMPQGEGLFITQASYYTTTRYFDAHGTRQTQPRFTKRELQPYVEYGLRSNLTLGGTLYADWVGQSHEVNSGIADPEVFARTRIWHDDRQILSLQPLIKFPSYYAIKAPPRSGSMSTDAELSLLYGRNQPMLTARDYLDMRLGYRARSKGLSGQIRADVATGIKWNESVEVVPALRGIWAVKPREETFREDGEMDYSLLKAEVKTLYHLDAKQWLEAGAMLPVAGVQTGEGFGLSVAYARRF